MISAKTALAQEALIDTWRSKAVRCLAFMKEKDATIAKLRDDLTAADLVGGDLVFQLAEKHQEIQRLNGVIGQQKAVILKMERARDTSGVEDPGFNIHDGRWVWSYSTKLFGPQLGVSGPKAVAWP